MKSYARCFQASTVFVEVPKKPSPGIPRLKLRGIPGGFFYQMREECPTLGELDAKRPSAQRATPGCGMNSGWSAVHITDVM